MQANGPRAGRDNEFQRLSRGKRGNSGCKSTSRWRHTFGNCRHTPSRVECTWAVPQPMFTNFTGPFFRVRDSLAYGLLCAAPSNTPSYDWKRKTRCMPVGRIHFIAFKRFGLQGCLHPNKTFCLPGGGGGGGDPLVLDANYHPN